MIRVTEVLIYPPGPPDRPHPPELLAFASILLNDAIVIRDIKLIRNRLGRRLLDFPSKPRKGLPRQTGNYLSIAYPVNQETRDLIHDAVYRAYDRWLSRHQEGECIDVPA